MGIAFGVCTGIGFMLSIGGSINLFFFNYSAFAVLYSLGTICALIGTGFLRGPLKQLKALTDPKRLVAVLVMIVMIIVSATVLNNGILALIFCILRFLSYLWYCLSYIPYGREAITNCFKSCV